MRTDSSTVNYLLGDHPSLALGTGLGSTAITTDVNGLNPIELRYYPWGTERYASGATPTTFKYTGQRLESLIGLYYYRARWYDPYLNRWIQPDSIIPNPYNSQSYDRYAYAFNNPVKYTDPSGHLPEWLENAIDYAQGAAYQFTNDMTFGLVENIASAMNLCVDCNRSEAFYEGQQGGRVASTVVSSTEAVLGTAAAAEGLAAMGPTAGGGLLCGAVTAGGCVIVAGVGLTAEGVMVLGGTAVAGHGALSAAYIQGNPIQQHHPWPEYLLGPKNQQLYGLSKELHVEYHRQLDEILSRQFGKDYYQQMLKSPDRLNEVLEYLRDFNRYFDDTYGTHTFEALDDVLRSEGLIPK